MTAMRRGTMLALVCGALALSALSSTAEDPQEIGKRGMAAADVDLLTSAYRLAEFGQKYKSPEAYLTAANLVLRLDAVTNGQFGELSAGPEAVDEQGKPLKSVMVETQKAESLADLADGFFESASLLGRDVNLSSEVEALRKAARARTYKETSARGAHGGPKLRVVGINPNGHHSFHISFDRQELAAVGFAATAPLRISMDTGGHVHYNQLISVGQYSWIPAKNVAAHFSIHNPHNVKVTYRLFTN